MKVGEPDGRRPVYRKAVFVATFFLTLTAQSPNGPFVHEAIAANVGDLDGDGQPSSSRKSNTSVLIAECKRLAGWQDEYDPEAGGEKTIENDILKSTMIEATAACNKALTMDPANSRLKFLKARIALLRNFDDEVVRMFRSAAESGSLSAMKFLHEILLNSQHRDPVEAKKWSRRRLEEILKSEKKEVSPDTREAIAFLDTKFLCSPDTERYNEKAPFAHIAHVRTVKTIFVGTYESFQIAVFDSNIATNTSYPIEQQSSKTINFSQYYTQTARWNSIDPRIEVNAAKVTLSCRSTDCFHAEQKIVDEKWQSHKHQRVEIEFCSSDVASRVAAAMRHLIIENGGRASKF